MNPLTFIEFENHIIQLDKVLYIEGPILKQDYEYFDITFYFNGNEKTEVVFLSLEKAQEAFDKLKKLFQVIKA